MKRLAKLGGFIVLVFVLAWPGYLSTVAVNQLRSVHPDWPTVVSVIVLLLTVGIWIMAPWVFYSYIDHIDRKGKR